MYSDYATAVKQERERFVAERAQLEREVADWWRNISALDPDIVEALELPKTDLSLQTLCPELYSDKPDVEVYHRQYIAAKEMIDRVNACADKWNEEALKCLSEFQELNSKVG